MMISPDLLHQLIKGTFKDHLVSWVEEYLVIVHGKTRADAIMDDIDRRYDLFLFSSSLSRLTDYYQDCCCACIQWATPLSPWVSLQAVDWG